MTTTSKEQIALIANILDGICQKAIEPYMDNLLMVGRCRYCYAIGMCDGDMFRHDHQDTCVVALNAQLQQAIKEDAMGGKPKTTTPADMRLSTNKKKYGSVENRDATRKPSASEQSAQQKKGNAS